jgi:hypothetical protein
MADDDPLRRTFANLQTVAVVGPRLATGDSRPLWRVFASAPKFGLNKEKKIGVTADNVHSLRLAAADAPDDKNWRNPRLVDLHLSIGSVATAADHNYASAAETLEIAAAPDRTPIKGEMGALFHAGAEAGDLPKQARFVHVVGEPLPPSGKDGKPAIWPRDDSDEKTIETPTMRLVAGRILLHVKLVDSAGRATPFAWLRDLRIAGRKGQDKEIWGDLHLTPDGIEFDADLPFPKKSDALLGRVLLTCVSTGGKPAFAVTLLKPKKPGPWLEAWGAITPTGAAEKALTGFLFKADRSVVPAFRWSLAQLKDGKEVEAPGDALMMVLLPSAAAHGDGSARLQLERIVISETGGVIKFEAAAGRTDGVDMVKLDCLAAGATLEPTNPIALDVDDDRFAADLRRVYGLSQPQLVKAVDETVVANPDPPLLSAFAPLADGWLQFHTPNLPPIDTNRDANLAAPSSAAKDENVLDGYFRLRAGQPSAETMSAYRREIQPRAEPPLELTIARATGVKATLSVDVSATKPTPKRAYVKLYGAALETRGLLFVSAARPSALEALPRLAAGPGLLIPLSMRGTTGAPAANSILGATLKNFKVTASRNAMTLNNAELTVTFDAGRARWREITTQGKCRAALRKARKVVFGETTFENEKIGAALAAAADLERADLAATDAAARLTEAQTHHTRIKTQKDDIDAQRKQLDAAADPHEKINELVRRELDDAWATAEDRHVAADAELHKAETIAGDAEASRIAETAKFTEAMKTLLAEAGPPLPAVAWLRHPTTPLAAAMPMTRAACGAVEPMETRGLVPYRLKSKPSADKVTRLEVADLKRSGNDSLPILEVRERARIAGWPWAEGDFEGRPERGVAFAAVGAPGLEARPAEGESAAPTWEIAYRYDLPTLDEAFATASLPPAHDDDDAKKPADARPAAEQMVPTALDWGALGGFWAEQERKLQNARVVSSHLTKFVKEDKVFGDDVTNLIEGVAWPVKATMKLGAATEDLPFGRTVIDDGGAPPLPELQGVAALKGATRNYEVKNGKLEPRGDDAKGEGIVSVVGFAPSTYAKEGFHLDNRRSGAIAPIPGAVQRRELRLGGERRWLASLEKPVEATINGAKFRLWFKDALFKDGKFLNQQEDIDFGVWREAEKLAAAGFEWRFFAENFGDALIQGRDVIPFFGFDLEPLRLVELKIDALATAPSFKSAKILCRLFLGPVEDAPDCGVNLVFLSIEANAGALSAKIEQVGELRYILDCAAKSSSRCLDAKVKLGGAAGAFAPVIEKLYMRAGGAWIDFGDNAKIEPLRAPEARQVTIAYEERAAASPSQRGVLAISAFKANIGRERNDIALRRRIRIAPPDSPAGKPVVEIEEAFGGQAASAKIFGVGAALSGGDVVIEEGDGAVALTLSKADVKLGEAKFIASLALAGRVAKSAVVGTLELAAFHAAVDLVQVPGGATILPGVTLEKGRARILAAASPDLTVDKAALARANTATFSGVVTAESAISWPAVVAKSLRDSEIPFPNNAPGSHGGSWVKAKPGSAPARHQATWTFRGHRAPIALVAALAASDKNAVFIAFVTARHELSRPASGKLVWSSVETLAIGAPCALVPQLDIKKLASDDSTTFAPRYRDVAKDGEYQKNGGVAVVAAGMKRPGRGAVATVLQGALGAAFRASFESEKREEKLLLAGGFLGLVAPGGNDSPRPLLRLPILAGLKRDDAAPPIAQAQLASKEWRIAWADGPATRLVSMSQPTAPQPASTHADSVAAAVAAGSDELWRRLDIGAADPVGALLVEQSFPAQEFPREIKKKEDIPLYGKLDEAPFFLASAVAVTRVLDDYDSVNFDKEKPVSALALCAGFVDTEQGRRPLAAALSLVAADVQSAATNERERARLMVVGTKVGVVDWSGPNGLVDDKTLLGPAIARMTLAIDAKPVAALVVAPPETGTDPVRFVSWTAQESGFERSVGLASDTPQFPDIGRGRMHPPSPDDTANPLFAAPPLEGPARPVRDGASGVAGLGRRVALPMQAGEAGSAENPPRPIWLTQTRVPVYLPLQTTHLRGPPLGWLVPASAKVRLPTDGSMHDALYRPDDNSKKPSLQPFLPTAIDAAEIGDRAGVATIRRARLLSAVALNWRNGGSQIKAFDPDFARFGLPAQAGSSFARALRTPRPGPLPENTGDPGRDRRIQASYLRPQSAIDAYFGPADVIGGEHDALGRWSIVAVAMPDSRGLFSERWDGTVKVVCRIEIEIKGCNPTQKPMTVLSRLLLPESGPSALLRIGDAALPMERMIWGDNSDAAFTPENGRLAAKVELTFEPAEKTSALTRKPHPVIAAALADAALPPSASLQWLAFPSNRRGDGAPTDKPLKLGAPGALSVGDDLAPVALRFPLYPVAPSCGALPLAPATILFGDPAYDRDLAGQPVVDEAPLPESKVENAATDRGRLRLSLYADRRQVNRDDCVALMLDLRYERPLSDAAQTVADADANVLCSGGDLLGAANQPSASLSFKVKPREGAERDLRLGSEAKLPAAKIGVFALAALQESDGSPARLAPGDMLEIKAEVHAKVDKKAEFQVWDAERAARRLLTLSETTARVLRLTMTAEATTPPPPALYVALLRTQEKGSIATALHAQSPTPWRVDIAEPMRGFRRGLLRRRAAFVWMLMRPEGEFGPHPSLTVVKQDRNGQTSLPGKADDFTKPT